MKYNNLATKEVIIKTKKALEEKGLEVLVVDTKEEALSKIKELIPESSSVMNGSSVTLQEIGYIDYLKSGSHGWNNLHEAIVAEKDPEKQKILRAQAVTSDYYLGSVHAIAETGEMVIASNSGSQLPHVVYTSPNIIFVVGAQKIVPTMMDAMNRLNEYVVPLEDKRAMNAYGSHTFPSKIVIFNRENPGMARKVRMIIVNEKLGY